MKLSDRFEALDATRSPDLWQSIEHREPRPSPPTMPGGRRAIAVAFALVIAASGIAVAVRAFQRSATQTPVSTSSNGLIAYVETDDPGNGPWRIVTIEPDGSGRQVLTAEPGRYGEPAWSPDGSRLALTLTVGTETRRIATISSDGSGLKELTHCDSPECLSDTSPVWSPDGSEIAWARMSGAHAVIPESIFVLGAARSAPETTLVLPGLSFVGGLAWSPDGARIAFDASEEGTKRFSIYVVDVNDGTVGRLTNCPISECSIGDLHPSWAPDGSRIVFARDGDLYLMNANGSDVRRLYSCRPSCTAAMEPVWSPDERKIAFAVQTAKDRDLYVIGSDGSDAGRLTDAPGDEFSPVWQPIPVETTLEPTPDQSPDPTASPSVAVPIPIESSPGHVSDLTYGFGSVWVASYAESQGGRITRLDPTSGEKIARISTGDVFPTWEIGGGGLTAGDGSLWLAGAAAAPGEAGGVHAFLVRIDPDTNAVTARIDLGTGSGASVVVDDSGVWALSFSVTDDGSTHMLVTRVDPSSNAVVATIPLEAAYGHHIFAVQGSIVAQTNAVHDDTVAGTVMNIVDPATNTIERSVPLGSYAWPAADETRLWALDGGTIISIDPATGKVLDTWEISNTGDAAAAGEGGVWFLGPSHRARVSRFDPDTGGIDVSVNLDRDSTPIAMAVAPGSIWVLNYEGTVTRVSLS